MKRILIDYSDMGSGCDKNTHFFTQLLRRRFEVEIVDRPDLLIYSHQGHVHRLHSCLRLFYTDETIRPDFNTCDYALTSFAEQPERGRRLPCYALSCDPAPLIRQDSERDIEDLVASKKKFCSFVVSNPGKSKTSARELFFRKLHDKKPVDSGGRYLNNIGGPLPNYFPGKIDFLKNYKFNIAYENASVPGYVTEKLVHAFHARCVPVYWGDPLVARDFNPEAFLNRADFDSDEALIARMLEIDRDDALLAHYLRQPCFHHNVPNAACDREALLDFFERALDDPRVPRGSRRRWFSFRRWTLARRNKPYVKGAESFGAPGDL